MTKRFEKKTARWRRGAGAEGADGQLRHRQPEDAKADVTPSGASSRNRAKDAPSTLAWWAATFSHPRFSSCGGGGRGRGGGSSSPTRSLRSRQGRVLAGIGGKRYDCGSKLGYLKATVELGCAIGHRQGVRRVPAATWTLRCLLG
jgi:hypothetical protein